MTPLDNFAFVLVSPKASGNVGAAARALKNMGFADLRLVAPRDYDPRAAAAMAVHADDLLGRAAIFGDLGAALADRTLTVGTTSRLDPYRAAARPLRAAAPDLIAAASANRVALVFGPEDFGLRNHEVAQCQRLITIPAAAAYPSLNLAQAVMVTAYELAMTAGASAPAPAAELADAAAVEAMQSRLAEALVEIGFLPADNPGHIMHTLRALMGRAGLHPRELEILNGLARQIRWFAEGGHATLAAKRAAGRKLR
ncbi:MAG TPA: TrmJ/YjtD family RNA methyltransferase [Candidatus Binataceae bacterium]|nr:TrmJ/YjtD family RNA methyltransferase [Candidatus Binataceae bacterium]